MTAKILSLYLLPLALLLWLCISFLRFYIRERKNYAATEEQSEQNLESKTKYRVKDRKKTIPFKVVFKRYWRVKRFRFVSRLKRMIGFFGKIFGALKWVFSNKKRTGMIVIAIVLLAGVAVMPSVVSIVQTTMRENQYEWRVLDDGTVVIDRYTGKSPEVQIPATISGTRVVNHRLRELCPRSPSSCHQR
jgi:hypothetical protein